MPRTARIKSNHAIYHIIMRGLSDINLFRNNSDKTKYLEFLRKYKDMFLFKIYAYCIMDTHIHLLIDSNGADVSKFMHNINQCYAQYYNKKYNRIGHVFGDRFKSKIATTDVSILCMSAYIHNNPKDIRGYRNSVENYNYSSFNIYIGKNKNLYNLLDTTFILDYFNTDPLLSRKRYYHFVKSRIDSNFDESNYDTIQLNYPLTISSINSNKIKRNFDPKYIIKYVTNCNNNPKYLNIKTKFNHTSSNLKAICAFLMRCFCNYDNKKIQNVFGDISLSYISTLCNKGYMLIKTESNYKNIFLDFIEQKFDFSD